MLAVALDRIVGILPFHGQDSRRANFRAATNPAVRSGTKAAAALNFGDFDTRRNLLRIRRGTPSFSSDLSTFGIFISASFTMD